MSHRVLCCLAAVLSLGLATSCDKKGGEEVVTPEPTCCILWRTVDQVVSVDLFDVWGGPDGYWACGDSGTVLSRGVGQGLPWNVEVSHDFDNAAMKSIWLSSGADVWIAGGSWATGGAKIEHFDGTNWNELASLGLIMTYNAIWGSEACDVYFGGVNVMSLDGYNLFRLNCVKFDSLMLDMRTSPVTGVFGGSHRRHRRSPFGRRNSAARRLRRRRRRDHHPLRGALSREGRIVH